MFYPCGDCCWVGGRSKVLVLNLRLDLQIKIVFIGSMYGIFTYMYHKNQRECR